MSIHHATRKRAETEGIAITEYEAEGIVFADAFSTTIANAKVAVDRAVEYKGWKAEYPNIDIQQVEGAFHLRPGDQSGDPIATWAEWPSLDEVLEACMDADLDPEEGLEDEEPIGGSVVAAEYKRRYATTEGSKTHSGDWLALRLESECGAGKGFDLDAFRRVLSWNGVREEGKWAAVLNPSVPSSVGRFRMNGSQKLRNEVAYSGKLVLCDGTEEAPAEWRAEQEAKCPRWFEKRRKADAAADDAAKSSVEG